MALVAQLGTDKKESLAGEDDSEDEENDGADLVESVTGRDDGGSAEALAWGCYAKGGGRNEEEAECHTVADDSGEFAACIRGGFAVQDEDVGGVEETKESKAVDSLVDDKEGRIMAGFV
jgi:hypothetical protein